MIRVQGTSQRLCDGVRRRDFLHVGALGCLGLSLPALLRAEAARHAPATSTFGKARRCILLFLTGGPPQLDTWDLKPTAPERIRGEFRPIQTRVNGLHVSERFPRIAQHADKLCIVRSVTHPDRTHTSAGYTMLTGVPHPSANAASSRMIRPGPLDHPHIGALLAKVQPARHHAPAFVSLPEAIKDAGVNPYPGLDGGLLGNQYAPFRIEANADRTAFLLPDVFLPPDITSERLADRRILLDQIERGQRLAGSSIGAMSAFQQQAFDVMQARAVPTAFNLDRG